MSAQLQTEYFTGSLYALLDETFDNVHGFYLDQGTSLFETLATISAEEASIPVGGKCATVAAQVRHVAFYLDVLEKAVRTQQFERQDWGKIWRETNAVTPAEWESIKAALRQSYERIKALIADTPAWSDEQQIGGVIATIVHTAYHLGEIRQALCIIKP
ncbi:MAG: DinB family protein [Caldilineaceae bacterium]|nr:DinB family protein [Caldilineaceae bacterium]